MEESYHVIDKKDSQKIEEYLLKNAQYLLPIVELIEGSRVVIDELIAVMGRASIEAVLSLSAQGIAGEKHQGKKGGEIYWHGSQKSTVRLSDRKLKVEKPRLRKKSQGKGGEVEIPAFSAINSSDHMGERILDTLMRNVSVRNYGHIITEMAETVGVSKSNISREFIEASAKELESLMSRRFDDTDLLVIYIDGIAYGDYHVIGALGVDITGEKHVLGVVEGATENGASATSLLENLVERGVDPSRKYLFVIDGSKALRSAICKVFGARNYVQRCRNHKVKNVCDKLPKELSLQVKSVMKAAYKLPHKEGIAKLKKQVEWLEAHYPDAAGSLLEGLEETFTINRLELSPQLCRCLGTTNIIESPYSGVRRRTNRVSRWRNGKMLLRWVATAFLSAEKSFNCNSHYLC
jgi:transposase-like protein